MKQQPRFGQSDERIRPQFASLKAAIDSVALVQPIYEAILVGVGENRPADFFEEVLNRDGYYQALVGFDPSIGLGAECDGRRVVAHFHQLSRVAVACPLAMPDREAVRAALKEALTQHSCHQPPTHLPWL